jgi:hypothetical protein
MKGTAQILFILAGLVRLPIAAAQGQLSQAVWQESWLAVPFVGFGLVLGMRVSKHVDAVRFQRVSWMGLTLLGTYLCVVA